MSLSQLSKTMEEGTQTPLPSCGGEGCTVSLHPRPLGAFKGGTGSERGVCVPLDVGNRLKHSWVSHCQRNSPPHFQKTSLSKPVSERYVLAQRPKGSQFIWRGPGGRGEGPAKPIPTLCSPHNTPVNNSQKKRVPLPSPSVVKL